MTKLYSVKFQSFNKEDYYENVVAKDEKEARKLALKATVRHDDRDKILDVKEDHFSGV